MCQAKKKYRWEKKKNIFPSICEVRPKNKILGDLFFHVWKLPGLKRITLFALKDQKNIKHEQAACVGGMLAGYLCIPEL